MDSTSVVQNIRQNIAAEEVRTLTEVSGRSAGFYVNRVHFCSDIEPCRFSATSMAPKEMRNIRSVHSATSVVVEALSTPIHVVLPDTWSGPRRVRQYRSGR